LERNLLVAGFGGQGVMLFGNLLATCVCEYTDKNVTYFPSYGAEQRGGTANCYVVISDEMIGAPVVDEIEDLIVLNEPSLDRFLGRCKKGGRLFVNSSIVTKKIERVDIQALNVPVTDLALEMGNSRIQNLIMLGAYVGYTDIIPREVMLKGIEKKLGGKRPDMIPLNQKAFCKGFDIGREACVKDN
jgi:2-oxoglutarate ferredoxin oxidoreductase subunit gamma